MGTEAVALGFICLLAGLAIGMWYGETGKTKMLTNMLTHGTPDKAPAGKRIVPETAEIRIDRAAELVDREFTKATIAQGVLELKALYVSEGQKAPSDKKLEAEVKDMLSRAGTPEAGVPLG